MKKKKIIATIFEKYLEDHPTWRDIKHIEFEDNDMISINYSRGEQSDYSDSGWCILVEREREENDEEYYKRITQNKDLEKRMKNKRYETYLKLKEEFEK